MTASSVSTSMPVRSHDGLNALIQLVGTPGACCKGNIALVMRVTSGCIEAAAGYRWQLTSAARFAFVAMLLGSVAMAASPTSWTTRSAGAWRPLGVGLRDPQTARRPAWPLEILRGWMCTHSIVMECSQGMWLLQSMDDTARPSPQTETDRARERERERESERASERERESNRPTDRPRERERERDSLSAKLLRKLHLENMLGQAYLIISTTVQC